jgi:hypothetical protein
MWFLELDLDPLAFLPLIFFGEEEFSQALTPGAQIFHECRAVAQDFQDVTAPHIWRLHGYFENRLGALHAKSVYN